jgi:hypothetical protein
MYVGRTVNEVSMLVVVVEDVVGMPLEKPA